MHPDVNSPAGSEASVVFTKGGGTGDLQLPDAGLLFFCKCWVFSGCPGGGEETTRIMSPGHQLKLSRARVLRQLHLIISVHLTASCSSISLSLYWLRSISTRAISTRVKRFLWAVGTSLCGSTQRRLVSHRRTLGRGRAHAPSCKILTSSSSLFLFFMSSTSSRTLEEILYQLTVLLHLARAADLLFQFLLQLSVLVLQLGLGLQDCLQLPLKHLLLAGQFVHLQDQIFVHYVQGVPAETEMRAEYGRCTC